MTDPNDKRSHRRVPIEVEIDLESEHNFYSGLTSDISEGGVFVGTDMLPPIGEELELSLKLLGHDAVFPIRGTVRWLRNLRVAVDGPAQGFGMQWKELSSDACSAIREFVTQREPLFFDVA